MTGGGGTPESPGLLLLPFADLRLRLRLRPAVPELALGALGEKPLAVGAQVLLGGGVTGELGDLPDDRH